MVRAQKSKTPYYDQAIANLERAEKSPTLLQLVEMSRGEFLIDLEQTEHGAHILIIEFPHADVEDFYIDPHKDMLATSHVFVSINGKPETIRDAKSMFNAQTKLAGLEIKLSHRPVRANEILKLDLKIRLPGFHQIIRRTFEVERYAELTPDSEHNTVIWQ